MAEIVNSTMFTNGANIMTSCNSTDLLQQAFQQVVDEQNHDNEFVTFLTSDGQESQTIQLTRAQASALRLTFEVGATNDDLCAGSIDQQQCQNVVNNVHNVNYDKSPQQTNQINFDTTNQWSMCHVDDDKVNNQMDNSTISLKTFELSDYNNQSTGEISTECKNNVQQNVQTIFVPHTQTNVDKNYIQNVESNCNDGGLNMDKNTFTGISTSSGIQNTQAQVIHRLPVTTYSTSQLIIKPTQIISKVGKSIRLIPSTSKLVKAVGTGNSASINSQNSVLLPKATLLNSMSCQVLKTLPNTPQLIHRNTMSAQLLDSSQILSSNLSTQNVTNGTGGFINGNIRTTQNLTNAKVRLSPYSVSTTTTTGTRDSTLTIKSLIANGMNTNGTGQSFKSLHIPTQILKTGSVTVGKTINTSVSDKESVSPSMIIRTDSRLKNQVTSKHSLVTGTVSTPVSILKPQVKVAFTNNSTRQTHTLTPQSINVNTNNHAQGKISQKLVQQSQTLNSIKSMQMDTKLSTNEVGLSSQGVKTSRHTKLTGANTDTLLAGQIESAKPLGSSENPIQIVQQGHTFHSNQKLTQSQLKQIAHVLQQRSQESSVSNERVVYRVVFPEELDLRIRDPINLLKGRGGKRGRPKKKPSTLLAKPTATDDEPEDLKEERKKPVARTRSGRLSRPPRHIVRDYKHIHPVDFTQPDLDNSGGGYSDYNMDKVELEEGAKDLLTGYEGPKRKISDHFRCPTCNKIYLGRTRMAKHFEIHPDHGSPEQLPPLIAEPELKTPTFPQDPFKRKGKKRGPWAYITPEAKSERRQVKLREALSACDSDEILKIAGKPVLDTQSMFDLMVLKSDHCLKTFLNQLKLLMEETRQHINFMLSPANDKEYEDILNLDDDVLCDALGLVPGCYSISEQVNKSTNFYKTSLTSLTIQEPPMKMQKVQNNERKENNTNKLSDLSQSNLNHVNTNCPEVLTALTLMPRNASPTIDTNKSNVSKLLISNTEIQSQLSDNSGFQKIQLDSTKSPSFKKLESIKDTFNRLNEMEMSNCSSVFTKLDNGFQQSNLETIQPTFIKLEPLQKNFVKLENGATSTYDKNESQHYEKLDSDFDNIHGSTQNFTKSFQKIITKITPMSDTQTCVKSEAFNGTSKVINKLSDNLPIIQDTVPIMSTTCDTIFGNNENLDITKMTNYDLDILSNSEVIDKHLIMDEKLVEQLQLVDQSDLVDELVSERLKNIMPDTMLENNLMANSSNLHAELDFEALSEEFNRNTRS